MSAAEHWKNTAEAECHNQFLACMFVVGSNKNSFDGFRNKPSDDHACEDELSRPPISMVEETLTIVETHKQDNHNNESKHSIVHADLDWKKGGRREDM